MKHLNIESITSLSHEENIFPTKANPSKVVFNYT